MKTIEAVKAIKKAPLGDIARVVAEMLLDGGYDTRHIDETIGALIMVQSSGRTEFRDNVTRFEDCESLASSDIEGRNHYWRWRMLDGYATREEAVMLLCFIGTLLDDDLQSESRPS